MEAAVDSIKENEEQQNATTGFMAASNANARSTRMIGDRSVTQLSYHSNIAAVEQERLNSLQNIVREKNRECQSYLSVIEQLRKENN